MKNISDYIFYDSWQLKELNLKQGNAYIVLSDLGDLKTGKIVKFIGFDDIDNHYGKFVFTDSKGQVIEVCGDFSSLTSGCLLDLKQVLIDA